MVRKTELRALVAISGAVLALSTAPANALTIKLEQISTPFNSPIGIDYFEPQNKVVISANYPSGTPSNFELVDINGNRQAFSSISGLTDEIKIATARSAARGGFAGGPFAPGTMFTGNGVDGQIVKINPDGTSSLFVDLPGAGNGLMRGSLYVDRTGVWNGDLLAVTTAGQIWRVNGAGTPTQVAPGVGTHLEGMITVPNDPGRYGAMAGKIIAGAEGQNRLYAFGTNGSVQFWNVGFAIEDIDIIRGNENFFGVNFGTSRLLGAGAGQFANNVGDILLTSEVGASGPGQAGLGVLKWDFVNGLPNISIVTLTPDSADPGQWEHVTFAPAGIVEIPPVRDIPEPGSLALLAFGLLGFGAARRRLRG